MWIYRWWSVLTAVTQMAGVVLRLVVHPHVIGDVSGGQQLPTDVTWHLLLMTDEVGTETIPRGECRRACLWKTRGGAQSHTQDRFSPNVKNYFKNICFLWNTKWFHWLSFSCDCPSFWLFQVFHINWILLTFFILFISQHFVLFLICFSTQRHVDIPHLVFYGWCIALFCLMFIIIIIIVTTNCLMIYKLIVVVLQWTDVQRCYRALERPLCRVHLSNVAVQVVRSEKETQIGTLAKQNKLLNITCVNVETLCAAVRSKKTHCSQKCDVMSPPACRFMMLKTWISASFICFLSGCVMSNGCEFVPGEGLGAVRTDVGFLHAALVWAHMVAHPVFPLEALLADGTRVGLLIWVGQTVTVEVINVSEGLSTGLTRVVLPHLVGVGAGIWILWSSSREDIKPLPASWSTRLLSKLKLKQTKTNCKAGRSIKSMTNVTKWVMQAETLCMKMLCLFLHPDEPHKFTVLQEICNTVSELTHFIVQLFKGYEGSMLM